MTLFDTRSINNSPSFQGAFPETFENIEVIAGCRTVSEATLCSGDLESIHPA